LPRSITCRLGGAALILALSACVPPEETVELSRPFPPETIMGAIQERGEIVIGIRANAAPLGSVEKSSGRARGLSARLGEYLAQTLGVEARFVPGSSAHLIEMVESGDADIAFVTAPITERAVRGHSFADPYYIGHQRLLVPQGVEAVSDLRGTTVCSAVDDATGVSLDRLEPSVRLLATDRVKQCIDWLRRGRADAATAVDSTLVSIKLALDRREGPSRWSVKGPQLSTVGFAPVVPPGLPAYENFVGAVLARAVVDGLWTRAYGDLLAPHLGPSDPPALSLEEAAALYPATVEEAEITGQG
jgi:glutamate transport system substrate-binding protein